MAKDSVRTIVVQYEAAVETKRDCTRIINRSDIEAEVCRRIIEAQEQKIKWLKKEKAEATGRIAKSIETIKKYEQKYQGAKIKYNALMKTEKRISEMERDLKILKDWKALK
jgi:DNA-binding protein H-NS